MDMFTVLMASHKSVSCENPLEISIKSLEYKIISTFAIELISPLQPPHFQWTFHLLLAPECNKKHHKFRYTRLGVDFNEMYVGHLCPKQNCFYLKFQGPFKIPSSGCFEETDRVEAYRGFVSKNALLECVSQADRPVCLEVVAVQSARANTPSFRYLERFSDHSCLKYLSFPRV